jgi:hypothetical protein
MTGGALVRAAARYLLPVQRDSAGRVVIPSFDEVSNGDPWARLEPLVDVLRKLPPGQTGSPYAWWDHMQDPLHGFGPWELALDVPFDWGWARPRVVLPDDVGYEPPPAGSGFGLLRAAGFCSIFSHWDPHGPTWSTSGWVQGQPYDGPKPAARPHWWSR